MSGLNLTTPSIPISVTNFGAGLNSTGGPLSLQDSESSDLQNIDFDKFGSIVKRNGYTQLNSSATTGAANSDGLHWFEYNASGTATRVLTCVSNGLLFKMDALDGTWDDITLATDMSTRRIDFTGSGDNDMTVTGTFSGNSADTYLITIASEGAPDTFDWTVNGGGGATGVNITGSAQLLQEGVSVTFVGTDNHTSADAWTFTTGVDLTADNFSDFDNFLNKMYMTNNVDVPIELDLVNDDAPEKMPVPSGLTAAKFFKQYNNYAFLANVLVSGTRHASRIYFSNIKTTGTWTATDFIEIAKDDGQEITGIKVLSDRLVVFKTRSIYNVFFTGDVDIPFILPGGGKSNSAVGCIAPYTIQELNNGLVFLSHDGFYFYDGINSFKISDKINDTVVGLNQTRSPQAVSMVQKDKTKYFCSVTSSGQSTHDRVLVWNFFNNAWSVYVGINASAMTTVFVNGNEERVYFGDYAGKYYRADTGTSDNPAGTETAIDSFYKTKWFSYGDLVNQKGVPHVYLYFQNKNSVLSFSYSYDFEGGDQYTQTFDMSTGTATYGSATYDLDVYAGTGGDYERRDLKGRGRVVRFKFANSVVNEEFQIDGLGKLVHAETNV
jgi:hypothetical protein